VHNLDAQYDKVTETVQRKKAATTQIYKTDI